MKADERFMSKVEKEPGGCWLWKASIQTSTGYGRFGLNGVTEYAHRASYALFVAPIPSGMSVLHNCDVRRCVRPEHLFTGTQKDNMVDASRKGRVVIPAASFESNEQHQVAKLTNDQVLHIRSTPPGTRGLARLYGVSKSTVWQARNGKTFRSV